MSASLVFVQPEWNSWQTALVQLADLENVHWLQPSGAPCRLLHAYVACTKLHSGNVAHNCDGLSAPHRLLVCILKKHTMPGIFDALSRAADAAATLLLHPADESPEGALR